jgi:hypothetical protein
MCEKRKRGHSTFECRSCVLEKISPSNRHLRNTKQSQSSLTRDEFCFCLFCVDGHAAGGCQCTTSLSIDCETTHRSHERLRQRMYIDCCIVLLFYVCWFGWFLSMIDTQRAALVFAKDFNQVNAEAHTLCATVSATSFKCAALGWSCCDRRFVSQWGFWFSIDIWITFS